MKIYTRTGDDGTTGLFGGERVAKTSPRVEAYGTVDELNSIIGLARAAAGDAELLDVLAAIQADLMVVGGDLATRGDSPARGQVVPLVGEADVKRLEGWIDALADKLPAMRHFILPGGCELAARLHVVRVVCRRAERAVLHLRQTEKANGLVVPYLNRLSDLLFVMARRANQLAGVAETPWTPREPT